MSFRERYGPWALVTGASAGIGAAFAEALARRGLHLALVARRGDRLDEAAARLSAAHGVEVLPLAQDLLDGDPVRRIETELGDRVVGLLINNAGFGSRRRFLDADRDLLRRMVRLNCEVPAALAHAFLKPMAERRRGGMVLVASVAGFLPTPYMAVYGATKSFDLHLGEGLSQELRENGVDVLTVCPGHTATEFHEVAGSQGPVTGGAADPADVAEGALARLGHSQCYVPGGLNKIVAGAPRLFPRKLVSAASARMLRKHSGL